MKFFRENALALIAVAALLFATAFLFEQYRLAVEQNRQIILRCVEKELKEGVNYDACIKLWKPFLLPFVSEKLGSY